MSFIKNITIFLLIIMLSSCTTGITTKKSSIPDKIYFSSSGFALIYNDSLYKEKVIKVKLNNENFEVAHSSLKKNTPIKIINPVNSKSYKTKVKKKSDFPKLFNVVITANLAAELELDLSNPFVEIVELKRNTTFIAKKSNTFDEEKNVAEKVPVKKIEMDDLSKNNTSETYKSNKKVNFYLIVSDFYYESSAITLKDTLTDKAINNNLFIEKINNNKYRLAIGPFKNFNALKSTYISLNNLGFEGLNIYRE